jgi:uncharacterized protein (DUF1330 family)
MPAYVIVEVNVHDPEKYEEYKKLSLPAVKKYGGKYLARGGKAEKLEGTTDPSRVVVMEFDSIDKAKEWWSSEEYTKAKKYRYEASESRMIVVEGLDVPL